MLLKHLNGFLGAAILVVSANGWAADAPAPADEQPQPELVRLQELEPPANGCYACLSGDGLTILWEVDGRVWMAERKSPDLLFENKAEISYGRHPWLSSDGLELFTTARRADGQQGESLHVATRPNVGSGFSRPREIAELNRQPSPKSPSLSADGLSLYFTGYGRDGKSTEFLVSTRQSKDARWSAPKQVRIEKRGLSGAVSWMCIVEGGERLLGTQEPPDGNGNIYIWTKQDSGEYSNPQLLRFEGLAPLIGRAPRYVAATKELHFTRVVGRGQFELWVLRGFDLSTVQ